MVLFQDQHSVQVLHFLFNLDNPNLLPLCAGVYIINHLLFIRQSYLLDYLA